MIIIDTGPTQGEEVSGHEKVLYVGFIVTNIPQPIIIAIGLLWVCHIDAIVSAVWCAIAIPIGSPLIDLALTY